MEVAVAQGLLFQDTRGPWAVAEVLRALVAELEDQEAHTRKARESTERYRRQAYGLQSEASEALSAAEEDERFAEVAAAHADQMLALKARLQERKQALYRQIRAATLALGERHVETLDAARCAIEAQGEARGAERRAQSAKKSLVLCGDESAAFAENAAAEKCRRDRARARVIAELQRTAVEREELMECLARHDAEREVLEKNVRGLREVQDGVRAENVELEEHLAELEARSADHPEQRDQLMEQIRALAKGDEELREKLERAQAHLWRAEARDREC